MQSESSISIKGSLQPNFETRSRLHINLFVMRHPFSMYIIITMRAEILSYNEQLTFVKIVQKEQERLETKFFAFITKFTWILSTLTNLVYLLQLQILDNANQHIRDMICNYIRWNRQFHFMGLSLPKKMDLCFEIRKTNAGIRISILNIPCIPIIRQNRQLRIFRPKFAQKWI